MRSSLSSRKAQFFVLSAFAIVSILLLVSTWLEPLSIPDTSTAVLAEERFVFNNIKEKAEETVKISKNCEELKFNLEEYKLFIQNFLTITKNIRLNFKYDIPQPCTDSVLETRFNISLESPTAFVFANFTSAK